MESIDTSMNTINNPAWFQNYRTMKGKFKQNYDDNMYYDIAMNTFLSMFKYDKRLFRPELFDLLLHDNGCCALIKTEISDYTPVFCNLVGGTRYPDGFFKNAFCVALDGKHYRFEDWRENPEIFVFFNNYTKTPDTFIEKYAYLLTNCDTSLDANVIFSRKKPIPVVRDKKMKNQIDQIYNDLNNGEIKTVISDTKLNELIDGNEKVVEVVNLTEVESSKYIQYLSQLHDNLISRLFFHMGLSMSDINKQAQVTQAELNKNKATSLAFLESWRGARQHGFDEIERKTGIRLDFSFSPIWKVEMENQLYSDREKDEESARPLAEEKSESEGEDNEETV